MSRVEDAAVDNTNFEEVDSEIDVNVDDYNEVEVEDEVGGESDVDSEEEEDDDYEYVEWVGEEFPPGVRFCPSDEELITHYLKKKVHGEVLPSNAIKDCYIYDENPEELLGEERELGKEDAWFFFTPRERKYPNGKRPRRSAKDGYWKPTGSDIDIENKKGKVIGKKKCLDFRIGKQPKGVKTGWLMYEYKIDEANVPVNQEAPSALLDTWVICKIYYKRKKEMEDSEDEIVENQLPEEDDENDKEPEPGDLLQLEQYSSRIYNPLPLNTYDPLPLNTYEDDPMLPSISNSVPLAKPSPPPTQSYPLTEVVNSQQQQQQQSVQYSSPYLLISQANPHHQQQHFNEYSPPPSCCMVSNQHMYHDQYCLCARMDDHIESNRMMLGSSTAAVSSNSFQFDGSYRAHASFLNRHSDLSDALNMHMNSGGYGGAEVAMSGMTLEPVDAVGDHSLFQFNQGLRKDAGDPSFLNNVGAS